MGSQPHPRCDGLLAIFRMNEFLEIAAEKLLLGIAQNDGEGEIAGLEPPIKIRNGDGRPGVLENAAKPLVALARAASARFRSVTSRQGALLP